MATKDFPDNSGTTVIGPSILISGKLTGDEDLTIRGRVEGELALTKVLLIEPSGIVKADVSVKKAIVSGVVVGNIAATESVELTKEGRMVGDIRAPRVIIVDGASFRGRVDMGNAEPGRAPPERSGRGAPASRTTAPARAGAPPRPPPPPSKIETKGKAADVKAPGFPARTEAKPMPPTPPVVAAGSKKKVVVRKKGR